MEDGSKFENGSKLLVVRLRVVFKVETGDGATAIALERCEAGLWHEEPVLDSIVDFHSVEKDKYNGGGGEKERERKRQREKENAEYSFRIFLKVIEQADAN